jgi:hypothetical protein
MIHSVKKYLESQYYLTYFYGKMRAIAQPYWSTKFKCNMIVPGLYLGDFATACNIDVLKKQHFTHVVTAILGVDEMYPDDFIYLTLPLRDIRGEEIFPFFSTSSDFIRNAIKEGGKVLVHCIYGVSRSATIVAAYLIKEYGMDANKAVEYIRSKRNVVRPNPGFMNQLQKYDAILHGKKQRRQSI